MIRIYWSYFKYLYSFNNISLAKISNKDWFLKLFKYTYPSFRIYEYVIGGYLQNPTVYTVEIVYEQADQ